MFSAKSTSQEFEQSSSLNGKLNAVYRYENLSVIMGTARIIAIAMHAVQDYRNISSTWVIWTCHRPLHRRIEN